MFLNFLLNTTIYLSQDFFFFFFFTHLQSTYQAKNSGAGAFLQFIKTFFFKTCFSFLERWHQTICLHLTLCLVSYCSSNYLHVLPQHIWGSSQLCSFFSNIFNVVLVRAQTCTNWSGLAVLFTTNLSCTILKYFFLNSQLSYILMIPNPCCYKLFNANDSFFVHQCPSIHQQWQAEQLHLLPVGGTRKKDRLRAVILGVSFLNSCEFINILFN